jgi:two-component system phosphate regulon sensor histidine kinase PhoR
MRSADSFVDEPMTVPTSHNDATEIEAASFDPTQYSLGPGLTAARLSESIAQRALHLAGGRYAAVFLRVEGSDPPRFVPQAVVGEPRSAFPDITEIDPDPLRFEGIFRPLLTEGSPQFIPDVEAEAERHGSPSGHPAIGSYIAHALFDNEGSVLGCLLVGDPRPGAFTEEHFDRLGTLTAQAAIAVQNVWLYARMQRALRESETLRFIGQQLAGQVDIDALLNQVVRHARAMLGADVVAVTATDARTGAGWVATVGFESDRFHEVGYRADQPSVRDVMAARGPLQLDVTGEPEHYPVLSSEGVQMAFGVPLLAGGQPTGALVAGFRQPKEIATHEIALAQALASHASISIENARLIAQAEARAMEADAERRLLRAVLESLPIGLIIADAASEEITHLNEMGAHLLGVPLTGASLADAVRALDARHSDGSRMSREEWPLERALKEGETVTSAEMTVKVPGEQPVPLLVNAAPVPGPNGTPVAGVVAFQDVSHLKEVERLKDEFLSIASHELKTPLTPLLGLTQFMLRSIERGKMPSTEQLAANLRTIHRQALLMSELVNDLLDVSRIQRGRLDLYPQEFDIVALAADILERFQSLQTDRNHDQFRLHAGVQSIVGRWDRSRIDQVLTNLISNAIKYSPQDSEITLMVTALPDSVRLSVRDRGIGIPEAEQHRLFEPFYRASNASVRNYPGVGLGLHITRELVERHGGRIWVESAEGQGSTFHVELPLIGPPPDDSPGVWEQNPSS